MARRRHSARPAGRCHGARDHCAGELVPHDAWILQEWMLALENVKICAADADAPNADEHFSLLGVRRWPVHNAELPRFLA